MQLIDSQNEEMVRDKSIDGNKAKDGKKLADILVADDNFMQSVALVSLLQQYVLEVDYVTDGQEAFEKVKKRFEETGTCYTLIIMDVFMPICNGFESANRIRAYLESSLPEPLYICILTAYLDKVFLQAQMNGNIDCYLAKPIFKAGV